MGAGLNWFLLGCIKSITASLGEMPGFLRGLCGLARLLVLVCKIYRVASLLLIFLGNFGELEIGC